MASASGSALAAPTTVRTSVHFTPLRGSSGGAAPSGLLEVDGLTLLLDCGWEPPFDVSVLEPLRGVAARVDAVLLSHGDLAHAGGLAYAFARLGLSCPVYATLPVSRLSKLALYDAHEGVAEQSAAGAPFTLDEIDAALSRVSELKYSQTVLLSGRAAGLSLTPLPAGGSLGGAMWRVSKALEEVLFLPRFSHQKALLAAAAAARPAPFPHPSRTLR